MPRQYPTHFRSERAKPHHMTPRSMLTIMTSTFIDLFETDPRHDLGAPYIIAEIGVNHEGSLTRAKKLIDLAKEGGGHAAKFQTYKAKNLAVEDSPAYWDRTKEKTFTQYELFSRFDHFNERDYIELADHCRKVGIDFVSTPFDSEAVEFLDSLVPFFKIASADITNLPLLRLVGRKRKPVVLSTGASNLVEIGLAVKALEASGTSKIALLHCILAYPTPTAHANLAMIQDLKENFPGLVIGYSDHTAHDDRTLPCFVAHLAGAMILEKHFTDDKSSPGNDHFHSMDCADLAKLTQTLANTKLMVGEEQVKKPVDIEGPARIEARRSLYTASVLEAGHIVTEKDLIPKRPGRGISPFDIDRLVGRKTIVALPADHAIAWEDFE